MVRGNAYVGERDRAARESIACASRGVGGRTGVIGYVSERTIEPDDPRLFHAITSVTNVGRLYYDEDDLASVGNSGAGLTRDIAIASAIGEALERYCCAIYDEREFTLCSFAELDKRSINATPPCRFALYSSSQYKQNGFIPHPFTEDVKVNWAQGYSLMQRAAILVPAALVYVPYRYRNTCDLIGFGVTTGLCCARSQTAAILGALYEVIERDAIMIMWMNQLPCPRINPRSGSWLEGILRTRFVPSGLKLHLNDITTDIPVPTMFALIIDDQNDGLAVAAGASTNLNPEVAAVKALVEAAQGRRWLKVMKKRDVEPRYREDFSDVIAFDDHVRLFASLTSIPYVHFLIHSSSEMDCPCAAIHGDRNDEEDLSTCLGALASLGLDAIIVDVTQPDIKDLGFCVMRVLVPGLIDINADHNYPRLGGERLYSVPGRLGFIGCDQEARLTRIPHPFP